MTKRIIALIVCLAFAQLAFAGIGGNAAVYRGGTLTGVPANANGTLYLNDQDHATYSASREGISITIPYQSITSIEYGQKAGRRVGAAIATAILVSPVGLALLLSKKRKHILTLGWTSDEGKPQGAVFELGKNVVRTTLVTLETRTGKKVEYETPEARANIDR